jgi:hypothetical protein
MLELGFMGFLFQLLGDALIKLHRRLAFTKDVDRLHLQKWMTEELMLPKVSCRNLVEIPLRLACVMLSSVPMRIIRFSARD